MTEFMQRRLLALDTATYYTGYAYFESGDDPLALAGSKMCLIRYGNMKAKQKQPFDIRCLELCAKIRNFVVEEQCTDCLLEYPEFHAGSRGVSASRGGATLTLAFLCGSVCTGWQLHVAEVMKKSRGKVQLPLPQLVRPSKWKGQIPKTISAARCKKKYGVEATKEIEYNYTDAIMMGDWWLKKGEIEVSHHILAERVDY